MVPGNSHFSGVAAVHFARDDVRPGPGRGARPHYNPGRERLVIFQLGQALYPGAAHLGSSRRALGRVAPAFEPGGTRRTAIFLGQSIFTPKNLSIVPPEPHDRPYAGWLYVGASLLQETGGRM